jgi:hypothetical protein
MNAEDKLSELETLITTNQPDFYAVGKALIEIRDKKLHQIRNNTFERYTQNQWDMSRTHAYRIISAVQVIDILSPIGDKTPENEAQSRPLTRFDRTELKKVWRLFLATEIQLTAQNIRRFVLSYLKQQAELETNFMSDDYKRAVDELLQQIEVSKNNGWKLTAKITALHWNKVMRAKIIKRKDG